MSTVKNKTTLHCLYDALNKKDLSELDQMVDDFFTSDFIFHPESPDAERGPEGIKKGVHQVLNDLPDIQHTIKDMIADGDKVVSRISFCFTDKETGQLKEHLGIVIDRFVGDKIAEEWELTAPGLW